MKTTFEFKGGKEFESMLAALPDRVANRVGSAAAAAAARVSRRFIRDAAPVDADAPRSVNSQKYGTLKSNIKVKRDRYPDKNTRSYIVSTGDAFWGYILEKGSRYIAANPWFSRAFESSQSGALAKMSETLSKRLGKEAEKLAKEKRSI